jgi:hypothetical protein
VSQPSSKRTAPANNQPQASLDDLVAKLINFQVTLIKNITLYREAINEKPDEFIDLVSKNFGQLVGDKLAETLNDNSVEFDGNMVNADMDTAENESN